MVYAKAILLHNSSGSRYHSVDIYNDWEILPMFNFEIHWLNVSNLINLVTFQQVTQCC